MSVSGLSAEGTTGSLAAAFRVLQSRCASVGLRVHTAKCNAYCRQRGPAQAVAATLGVRHAAQGIVVAGTPLGDDDFVGGHAATKATDALCAVDKLLFLLLSAQCQWDVLQGFLQHRVAHLPRVHRWKLMNEELTPPQCAWLLHLCHSLRAPQLQVRRRI